MWMAVTLGQTTVAVTMFFSLYIEVSVYVRVSKSSNQLYMYVYLFTDPLRVNRLT